MWSDYRSFQASRTVLLGRGGSKNCQYGMLRAGRGAPAGSRGIQPMVWGSGHSYTVFGTKPDSQFACNFDIIFHIYILNTWKVSWPAIVGDARRTNHPTHPLDPPSLGYPHCYQLITGIGTKTLSWSSRVDWCTILLAYLCTEEQYHSYVCAWSCWVCTWLSQMDVERTKLGVNQLQYLTTSVTDMTWAAACIINPLKGRGVSWLHLAMQV